MNHYGAKELAASFRTVRKNTILVAQDIPEDKYGFRAAPDTRSVAEMLAHIAIASVGFNYQVHAQEKRTTMEGFDFPAMIERWQRDEKTPRTKAEIIELLQSTGEKWAGWLENQTDAFLAEEVAMPPQAPVRSRTRFDMLLSVKEHEMHHRSQLMLMERMMGITPHLTREMQARFAAASAKK
jgi:uncharacterized damage-inducible protein DinB